LTAPLPAGKTLIVRTTLAIAGCGPRLEIAFVGPRLPAPALLAASGPTPRSDLIVAAIDVLLRASGLAVESVEAVVATTGPGSFTGIRVAMATAIGLASACSAPTHGFSSLLAQAARTRTRPCVAVQPARRGHVYAQLFDGPPDRPGGGDAPLVVAISELQAATAPVIAPVGIELPASVATAQAIMTTAEALLDLATRLPRLDPATMVPTYLEPPLAELTGKVTAPWLRSPRAS